jgi:ABC-type Na+ efflux pump permease subunit
MARQAPPVAADPPEATVTFVVRETRAPVPSSETAADAIAERNGSAQFERLRSLGEAPGLTAATYLASGVAEEEAEVTIVSVESLKQRRESDARAGIVRRFRKALSGD